MSDGLEEMEQEGQDQEETNPLRADLSSCVTFTLLIKTNSPSISKSERNLL